MLSVKFRKTISIFLIISLLWGRIFFASPFVFAEDLSPTDPPASTSAPQPTNASSSDIKPTSAPQPTSAPKSTTAPQPTSPPKTSSDQTSPTWAPTSAPKPTSSPQPTAASSTDANTFSETNNPTITVSPTAGDSQGGSTNNQGTDENLLGTSGGSDYSSLGDGSINDPANVTTGAGSTNNASETLEQKLDIMNKNLAEMQNKIDAISSTGFNYANLNTLQGEVSSGDSFASLNLLNKLNSNVTGLGGFSVFNIYNNQLGDLVFKFANGSPVNAFASASSTVSKNADTGPESINNAVADNSFTVKEANGNDATLSNDINLQAVSGGNTASYNTGGGSVKTGDSTALGNIINLANTNLNVNQWLFGVVNIFGTLAGNIVLPQDSSNNTGNSTESNAPVFAGNTDTGALSTNNATYNVSDTSNYSANNTANITSTLNVTANAGNNSASVNTGGGSVTTGSTDVGVSNSTIANTNTIEEDGTVWMVIVNEMGKWVGHIIGAPWGSTTASNALPITQTGGGAGSQTYSTVAQNSGTGPGSTNNATYNSTSNSIISFENDAKISNNITANADTGNNKAEYNTGAGQIETGNAKAGLNLVNMANTNVTAKKFVAILVNVMGNFLGDIVTPGQKSNTANSSANSNSNLADNGLVQNNTNKVSPTKTPSPTVIPYEAPMFTESTSNIGGISSFENIVTTEQSDQNSGNGGYYVNNYSYNQPYQYIVSANRVNNRIVKTKNIAQTYTQVAPIKSAGNIILKRGVFISPAFTKATETSIAAVLLGGATFKVNESWLSVIPFTLIFLALRRRKKLEFGKYINALLEIIL